MMKTEDYCFVCGKKNPKGLKAIFKYGDGKSYAEITLEKEYQGYSGIIHGGIVSTLLDEACAYAANSLGVHAVTAELKIRFKNPAIPGQKLIIQAEACQVKSKLIEAKARIENYNNSLIAEAESKLIIKEKTE